MARTRKRKKYKGKYCGKDCEYCRGNRTYNTRRKLQEKGD